MKKILFPIFLFLAACDSIDNPEVYDVTRAISAPTQLTVTEATTSSLTFAWEKVADAVQYGYTLTDADGQLVSGGTTSETYATVSNLDIFSTYSISLYAFPDLGKGAKSEETAIKAKTKFYSEIDASGYYYSNLRISGAYWSANIIEDRSASDYEEGTFGTFTITKFYNRNNYDLVFKVNKDKTIKVVNSLGYADEEGIWATVATGWTSNTYLYIKNILIDESSSYFDYENSSLSFTARTIGTDDLFKEDTETFDW